MLGMTILITNDPLACGKAGAEGKDVIPGAEDPDVVWLGRHNHNKFHNNPPYPVANGT